MQQGHRPMLNQDCTSKSISDQVKRERLRGRIAWFHCDQVLVQTHAQAVASPSPMRHIAFQGGANESSPNPLAHDRRRSNTFFRNNSETQPEADVYYDSHAATKREWRRRAMTLQDYYHENPELLPLLPSTWHNGLFKTRCFGKHDNCNWIRLHRTSPAVTYPPGYDRSWG